MGPLEQAPLLPWSLAFLAIEDLRTFLRLGPLTQKRHQELWYHATQALRRPYPFVPARYIRDDWETTYHWFRRNMATFAADAHRVLRAGLERARLPPEAVAARFFLRRFCLQHREQVQWDARLLVAAGCAVCGVTALAGHDAVLQALGAGADPNATLGPDPPYLARVADMDKPPLYFALQRGDLGVVQQLLAAGARPDQRDRKGCTMAEHAQQRLLSQPDCVAALAVGSV